MIHRQLSLSLVLTLVLALIVPDALAQEVRISASTVVPVRTTSAIYSDQVRNGQRVTSVAVARDVEVDDVVVIEAGTPVSAVISRASEAGRVGQPGDITLDLESTTAVDGTEIGLSGTFSAEGDGKVGASVAISVLLCPLALLMKGDEGAIASGTEIRALTLSAATIDAGQASSSE